MERGKVVVTQDRDFVVVSIYGVPVYTDADSGANKFDETDLCLVIVAPFDMKLVKARKEGLNATVLADDFDRLMNAQA